MDHKEVNIFANAENPEMFGRLNGLKLDANNIINDAYKRGLEEGKKIEHNKTVFVVLYDDYLFGVFSTLQEAKEAILTTYDTEEEAKKSFSYPGTRVVYTNMNSIESWHEIDLWK